MKKLGFIALLAALFWNCGNKPDAASKESAAQASQKADDDEAGNSPGVTLKKDAQERAGLKIEALTGHSVEAELLAYGKLEEDASTSFLIRAPYAGTLRVSPGQTWPAIGQTLAAHTPVGRIEPRLQLPDRLGLVTQISTAQAEITSSHAAAAAAQAAYDRAKALNADNKNISDRALAEAAARLAAEQSRESGARALLQTLENSLSSAAAGGAAPISAERGGEVMEVLAQPGESVEQGAPLVHLAQPDHLLARIDLPVGDPPPSPATPVRITAAGFESQSSIPAERVSIATGPSLLYRLSRVYPGMRPGTAVTARFAIPGRKAGGVLIPRSAIVQMDGRLWVYVQSGEDRFSRRPVPLDIPAADGYLTARGFAPGDKVVTTGAQTLLSEEFKSQNEADTN